MTLKIHKKFKVDNADEAQILTGMIVSDKVLRDLRPHYKPEYFNTTYIRLVANWCMAYFDKYKKSPKAHIQDIFNSHSRRGMDKVQSEIISEFLVKVSEDYTRKKYNSQYILDKAHETFTANALKALAEDIQTEIANNNTKAAQTLLVQYKKIEQTQVEGINPFTDAEAIYNAFEHSRVPLFTFPGELGRLLNDFFTRDSFISLMGKEKIGKTWLLMELAMRARLARCNVAFFEVGDMSQDQMTIRFHIRQAGRSDREKYCQQTFVPVPDCENNQDDTCSNRKRKCKIGLNGATSLEDADSVYKPCCRCMKRDPRKYRGAVWYKRRNQVKPLTWREAHRRGARSYIRLRSKGFQLVTKPNNSCSVTEIRNILDSWEQLNGFIPDVIVVDYADILASEPEDSKKDVRHQENGKWKALRRLSQERHCCVITATQTDAAAYDKHDIGLANFSEDKRKYAHVTVMLALNQMPEEKQAGFLRAAVLLAREEEFNSNHQVTVLQCLQMGRPCLASFRTPFKKKVEETE